MSNRPTNPGHRCQVEEKTWQAMGEDEPSQHKIEDFNAFNIVSVMEAGKFVNTFATNMTAALKCVKSMITNETHSYKDVEEGFTPLLIASQQNHLPVLQELIRAGAQVNAANNEGHTSVFMACQNNHLSVVQALIAAHADVNIAEKGQGQCVQVINTGGWKN
ncbi:unnamed protein product, partial [Meganyctiphanes norvegica]